MNHNEMVSQKNKLQTKKNKNNKINIYVVHCIQNYSFSEKV